MPASLIERPRRITEIAVSAMLAAAGMVVFKIPQALFELLGKISLYSFVLTFHLAFVIYHSTKPSGDDARGSRKPEEPAVSTRDYRFSSIRLPSSALGEFVSSNNEGDTPFIANIPYPRSRSSTTSSEIARHSSSNTSVVTLVETDPSKEAVDAYPTTLTPTRKHGTIFPDSEWATMNATQIRRIRRAVKRVKYKAEHQPPSRDVRSKTKKKDKDVMENDRGHEQEISKEDEQDDVKESLLKDDKDDQKYVESYDEDAKDDDEGLMNDVPVHDKEDGTEDDDEGLEGLMGDVPVHDKEDDTEDDDELEGLEGLIDDVLVHDKGIEEDIMKQDDGGVEEQFEGENEDMKEKVTEDGNVCLEENFMEDDKSGEEDMTKIINEGVEDNAVVYDSEGVDEGVKECEYECIQDDVLEEHNEVVIDGDDNEGHTKTAADGACKSIHSTYHRDLRQRNDVIMIPSLIKGWPPVLLSEPIMNGLDPIDFKIMQLECEYHLSREEPHNGRYV
ncbi:uncharacterized protein F5891DRAFT_249535 [Suillus fuscotomentosus]|uniref:Uncharacterized protein n=1 Tax=Suillus fuscotomentosus TaxID=1912939 RepID=A0AAD4HLW4_9AGAM|nr:uncharacterized protein F5891DRAFT_249535 [Suillus fuscotomentosus]KAG1901272.1 hypothetical protein F5891DRAFT_249535 [Suillus fuscotomentosus]